MEEIEAKDVYVMCDEHKIITIEGYCGTGSSAGYDLLREYKNCSDGGLGDYEHLLLYTPHGLFELEDRLLKGNSIHGSDAAIDDFYYAMKRLYECDFNYCGGYKKNIDVYLLIVLKNSLMRLYNINGQERGQRI